MKKHIILCAIFIATPAISAPTYLNCNFKDYDGGDNKVEIALDEITGSADVYFPRTNGRSQRRAMFTPSQVKIELGSIATLFVSRANLSMTRVSVIPGQTIRENGTCKKVNAPKRAF